MQIGNKVQIKWGEVNQYGVIVGIVTYGSRSTHYVVFTGVAIGHYDVLAKAYLNSCSNYSCWPSHCLKLINPDVTVRISKDYDAVVAKDGITVGCQNISWEKIDAINAARKTVGA